MKYFYNGKLVRTSKNIYNYVLVNHLNGCIAFSKNSSSLESQKNREIKFLERQLAYWKKQNNQEYIDDYIKDIENTKKWRVEQIVGIE